MLYYNIGDPMKWFRRNIRTGSRLALFALALQFVLSFGHVHFNAAQAAPAIQTLTDLVHAQDLAAGVASERQQPANHGDHQPSNEPCAICAVMSMANQLVLATLVLLPLPDATEQSFLVAAADFALPGSPRSAFRSRAPPVS
jgi:hypothetical protein